MSEESISRLRNSVYTFSVHIEYYDGQEKRLSEPIIARSDVKAVSMASNILEAIVEKGTLIGACDLEHCLYNPQGKPVPYSENFSYESLDSFL